jgi:hypothetical protein
LQCGVDIEGHRGVLYGPYVVRNAALRAATLARICRDQRPLPVRHFAACRTSNDLPLMPMSALLGRLQVALQNLRPPVGAVPVCVHLRLIERHPPRAFQSCRGS